jgi:hypothetical protein
VQSLNGVSHADYKRGIKPGGLAPYLFEDAGLRLSRAIAEHDEAKRIRRRRQNGRRHHSQQ